jgi:adenine-specific DNA-methyltransferase
MAEEFKPQYSFTDDRLNELKQLFPEAWEDGVFNVDTLRSLIGDYSTDHSVKEHFGLNWVGKQDARKIASKPPTGTLKPAPGEGVNEENTENIFIEGDNLEVLKILRKSYMGKIKMIYIDPPYNTGNDFIYNDSFGDSTEDYLRKSGDKSEEGLLVSNPKTSGKFHANWLTFMYPRLRLAKDFLTDNGAIFISIDHHELDNLKKVCDEIFGEENFITSFVWEKKKKPSFLNKNLGVKYENILCFAKNRELTGPFSVSVTEKGKKYPLNNSGNSSSVLTFPKNFVKFNLPDGIIEPQDMSEGNIKTTLLDKLEIQNGSNVNEFSLQGEWRYSQKKINEIYSNKEEIRISKIPFRPNHIKEGGEIKKIHNLLTLQNYPVGTNEDASEEIMGLLGDNLFDFTKPSSLIKFLIKSYCFEDKNAIVMDFFAGSATTCQSLLELNKEDQGSRKFIAIQLPELVDVKSRAYHDGYRTITEVSLKRLKKVIERLHSSVGFNLLKLGKSNIKKWRDFNPQKDGLLPDLFSKLEAAFRNPLVEGTTPEEFITEVMLQEGFPLTANQTEVQDGIFKISHDWVPYTLYVSMLQSFKDIDLEALGLSETDHFVCLDMAFENNDALKQTVDNQCKLFTV